jgi:hypothetical protein
MRLYIGFDDTDVLDGPFGAGKLVRRFESRLPDGCALWGVIRQQLLIDARIPSTSHNSSTCAVIDCANPSLVPSLIARAVEHIERESSAGSDPGLCAVREDDPAMPRLEILQHSEVIHRIQIVNGLERGTITRALKGEKVGTIIHKDKT